MLITPSGVKKSISLRLHFILQKVCEKILAWSKISTPSPSITLLIILPSILNSNLRADFNSNLTIGKNDMESSKHLHMVSAQQLHFSI